MDEPEKALGYFEQAEAINPLDEAGSLSIAEILILLDRHEEARARLAEAQKKHVDPELRTVTAFLQLTSLALRGDRDLIPEQFEEVLKLTSEACQPNRKVPAVEEWSYEIMTRKIARSDMDLRLRFMLLVSIDLQLGHLAAPSLNEFPLPLTLALPQRTARWSEQEPEEMVAGAWRRIQSLAERVFSSH